MNTKTQTYSLEYAKAYGEETINKYNAFVEDNKDSICDTKKCTNKTWIKTDDDLERWYVEVVESNQTFTDCNVCYNAKEMYGSGVVGFA